MIRRRSSVWSVFIVVVMLMAGVATVYAQAAGAPVVEPDKSMTGADEAFGKGDMNKASDQIKKAAAYLHTQETKVAKDASAGLKKAAGDLDRLSADVRTGAVKSADDLKKAFAKADHALATAWHATAEQEQKAGKAASTSVTNASEALEGAARWTGAKLDAGAQGAVDAVHSARRGARMGADAIGRAIRGIGEGIADVGKKIGS
jgi:hypothetical protein